MISSAIIKSNLKNLRVCIPINKPKNICCLKLQELFRADLNYVLSQHNIGYYFATIRHGRYLEPFANGLMTISIGLPSSVKRNYAFSNYVYRATIELGVERQYHCVDGQVTGRSSIEHLDRQMVEKGLEEFLGTTEQQRSGAILLQANNSTEEPASIYDIYDRISFVNKYYDLNKPGQKYPYVLPKRDVVVDSIKLIECNFPFLTIEISCVGSFGVRQFTADLGSKLGTFASLVELTRIKEGPMLLDDLRVLQIHDLNLEHYIQRVSVMKDTYDRFLDEMDKAWENMQQ